MTKARKYGSLVITILTWRASIRGSGSKEGFVTLSEMSLKLFYEAAVNKL